jgi:glutathione S-transferase
MQSPAINYISFEQAQQESGLRMIVVKGLPSPWGEAAKSIFHIKQLAWAATYHDPTSREMSAWAGSRSAPVAIYNDEQPISSWLDILLLAERLSPEPALLPEDPKKRESAIELCEKICGEMGLGWARRLDSVHKGLNGKSLAEGGYPPPIAGYLAKKYGYEEDQGTHYNQHTIELLKLLSSTLKTQQGVGSKYYLGNSISAIDIYSATFMACFKPLPEELCAMHQPIRSIFESLDENTKSALSPILLEHRDYIYNNYLALPLSL